jgi:hypothetical protein
MSRRGESEERAAPPDFGIESHVERAYFENYCGEGSYEEQYLAYSRVDHCISIVERLGIEVESVLVLGTATGLVLRHFDAAWGVRPWGCEISRWAHARVPARYRRRIRCADMRNHVPELLQRGRQFDLIFSNSLVYLPAPQIRPFLANCAELARYFHFWSSTAEDFEPHDRYRVTLESQSWWRDAFRASGYRATRSRYLWRASPPRPKLAQDRRHPRARRRTRC